MLKIKPLSVNECWMSSRGRLIKTKAYRDYEETLLSILPPLTQPIEKKPLKLDITAGLSNKSADIDNIAKPFIDILQKKYGFNDSLIYELNLKKVIVKKGEEFVKFEMDYKIIS